MIAQKMSLLEESGPEKTSQPQTEGRIQKQEQLINKINAIYNNKGLDKKEKIAHMNQIFVE